MSPARRIAFEVLRLVEQGRFASDLLRERTLKAKKADAALAHQIVFGVLRFQAQLDALAAHFSSREVDRLDREVRLALRIGIFQIRYLERIPKHAAVAESVDMVKRAHKRSAAGLVNAVMRKVDRSPVPWKDRATALSLPPWLLERWDRNFGLAVADGIAYESLNPPAVYIRVPASRRAEAEVLNVEETGIAGCYRLKSGDAGGFRRQDIGSQAIVGLLELEPGEKFLDLCAAPGNKTAQALETPVLAVACDSSRRRILEMPETGAHLVICDSARPLPFPAVFDKILVDAPCSGTGTIGRNPEIKWRVTEEDLARHQQRQVALLESALEVLRPGGRLVYSTCSLEPEENEQVVEEALGSAPEARVIDHLQRIPGRDPGDGFGAAVITSG